MKSKIKVISIVSFLMIVLMGCGMNAKTNTEQTPRQKVISQVKGLSKINKEVGKLVEEVEKDADLNVDVLSIEEKIILKNRMKEINDVLIDIQNEELSQEVIDDILLISDGTDRIVMGIDNNHETNFSLGYHNYTMYYEKLLKDLKK